MSTSSFFAGALSETPSVETNSGKAEVGVFARVMRSIVKAREVQARREADRYLSRQSDRVLRDIGLEDTEIAALRRRCDR